MKRKHRFVPMAAGLEERVVLSTYRGSSVVVSGLHPRQNVLTRSQSAISAEVTQAFTSFQNDYGQARSTYFSSIADPTAVTGDTTNAFTLYTKQRVSLLAQQLISSFLQYKPSTARQKGKPSTLQVLINHRIIGINGQATAGSLASSLLSTIPPAGTSAPTATLYSLSQDNAISAAQVAVLNGAGILRNGDFGNTPATFQTRHRS
ncbi:hypothetical protein OJF2_32370 [Aquisphaera giovannonii]|uniref:Uncharacterized protein n=1 Tax=Aquisphaera giovannonii TaxID=406548 RepID=A0A5B9W257_9BACT|nr:hypothetical protein [Aquisphaera giovannonii]QEH34696.1 hypothetical protein OJF2_32370 [Aquisphaera giovannonii]